MFNGLYIGINSLGVVVDVWIVWILLDVNSWVLSFEWDSWVW